MTLPQTYTDGDIISDFMLGLSYTQMKGLPEGCPVSIEEIRYDKTIIYRLTYKGSLFSNPCTRTVVTHI